MGLSQRNKGKRGERELAKILREYTYLGVRIEARRGQQFRGGSDSPDIRHSIPNVLIECKCGYDDVRLGSKELATWLDKAEEECHAEQVPVVIHRASRRPWIVYYRTEHGVFSCELHTWLVSIGCRRVAA